jgi:hypothetical protein
MAEDRSPSAAVPSDYEAIERAVAETERGRWFLDEFARRNRFAETRMLLDAVARLERALATGTGEAGAERIRMGLAEMEDLVAETKARVATAPFDSLEAPAPDPFAVVARTTRRAAMNLADTAERIRDAATVLRDGGVAPDLCRLVERQAVEVSTTATVFTLAAQRVAVVTDALARLDASVETLSALCTGPRAGESPWEPDADHAGTVSAWDSAPVRSRDKPTLVT